MQGDEPHRPEFKVFAHRGFSAAYPENTLLAFKEALALGVDGIELDVHSTADGTAVVIHDRAVERTTNGSGHVDELPLATLQRFDAGRGERVPTLAEVLELVQDRAYLDIEVKGRGIEAQVLQILAAYSRSNVAISSFDWDTLRVFRQLDSTIELWPLAEIATAGLLKIAADLGSPAVALYAAAYTAESAEVFRDVELEAMIWTVNDEHEARRVRDLGAWALCTDAPDRIMAVFDAR
jgi:glycerophosphoryl diester phosphodiesterase